MSTDLKGLVDRGMRFLGGSSRVSRDLFTEFLNDAGEEWWMRHEWKERRISDTFATLAPYEVGTATFTQGSRAVTGASTVWAATHTGMKIALAYGSPEYVFTRTAATTGVLDRPYVETTASGSAYVLYQDVYSLDANATAVLSGEMTTHRAGGAPLGRIERAVSETTSPYATGAGTPAWWSPYDVKNERQRVRLGPSAPDSVFEVKYGGLSGYVQMGSDNDQCVVPEKYRKYLVLGALSQGYMLYQRLAEASAAGQAFEAQLTLAWARALAADGVTGQITGVDQVVATPASRFTYPVSYP